MTRILVTLLFLVHSFIFGQLYFVDDVQTSNYYGEFSSFDLNSNSITSQIVVDSTGYYIDSGGKSTYDPINKTMYVMSGTEMCGVEIRSIDVTDGSSNLVYCGTSGLGSNIEYGDGKLYFIEDIQTSNYYGRFSTFDLNSNSITSQIVIDSTGYYIDSKGMSTYDPINKIMYVMSWTGMCGSEIRSIDVTDGSSSIVYCGTSGLGKVIEYGDGKLYFVDDVQTSNYYGRFSTFDLNSNSITSQIVVDSTGYYIDSNGMSTYDPVNKIMYVMSWTGMCGSEIRSIDVTNGSSDLLYCGSSGYGQVIEYGVSSSPSIGIKDFSYDKRKIIRTIDILGRETNHRTNTNCLLIEIYDDGSVEKRVIIE